MVKIVKGLEELQLAFANFIVDVEKATDDAVRITAFRVKNEAISLIREPSNSGNFKKGKKKRRHEISKEGDAPNTDTGRLIGSIDVSHVTGAQVAFVGTDLDYGMFLELDLDRPWLEPAKNSQVVFFSDNMKAAIDIQIKKAGK